MSSSQRKKTLFDRHLPRQVQELFPQSELYSQLQSAERRIDAVISRKRIDIQEAMGKSIKARSTLRIFISNYASDQPHMSPQSGGTGIPNWTLRVEGRLLDPNPIPSSRSASSSAKSPSQPNCAPLHKFSHFLHHLIVEIQRDPILYPEPNVAEYIKSHRSGSIGVAATSDEFDGFEVKRHGDQDCNVKIILLMDYGVDKFKISRDLAQVLPGYTELGGPNKVGVDQLLTKRDIVLQLFHYIKHRNLLDKEDKRLVTCDEKLKQVFGMDQVLFAQVPVLILRHLMPPDPIVIHYTVKVDQPFTAAQYVYDIDVEWEDQHLRQTLGHYVMTTETDRELAELDAQISTTMATLHNHRLKRDFMLAFAKDPVAFLNRYMESQARDLQAIVAGMTVNRMEARSASFYEQPWVRDAVSQYLATKYRT